jgi:hypothetical protein
MSPKIDHIYVSLFFIELEWLNDVIMSYIKESLSISQEG